MKAELLNALEIKPKDGLAIPGLNMSLEIDSVVENPLGGYSILMHNGTVIDLPNAERKVWIAKQAFVR